MAAQELTKTVLKDNANLKAYYRFESGALTTDSSGNGKTLTNNNTCTETTGKYGGGVAVNGSNQYLTISDVFGLVATNWSIALWAKTDTASKFGFLVNIGEIGGTDGFGIIQNNNVNSTAGNYISVILNNVAFENFSTQFPDTTNYHHIVVTRDSSTLRLYVNGAYKGSSVDSPIAPTGVTAIGSNGASYFDGNIDDVAIFGTALSADQIKELYEGRYLGELRPNQFGTTAGLWHLNGNSTDSSGNNNNGTDTAITYSQANGKFGQGALFTAASSSKILCADSASLDITGNLTFSTWANFTATGADYCIVSKYNHVTNQRAFALIFESTKLSLYISSNGTAVTTKSATWTPTTGVWYLISFVYTAAAGTADVYINGALLTQLTAFPTSIHNSSELLAFGCYSPSSGIAGYFGGKLDEVMLSPTALTAQQIRTMYALGKGMY